MKAFRLDLVLRVVVAGSLAAVIAGCGGPERRTAERGSLPFTVRLKEVMLRPPAAAVEAGPAASAIPPAPPVIPLTFESTAELTRAFALVLEQSGVFTRVLSPDDPRTPADLDLEIEVSGGDFGEGTPTVWGSISSTLVWLLAGHLSWFIDNRRYPDSDVTLHLKIRPVIAASRGTQPPKGNVTRGRSGAPAAPEGVLLALAAEETAGKAGGAEPAKRPAARKTGQPKASGGSPAGKESAPAAKARPGTSRSPAGARKPAGPASALFEDTVRLKGLHLNFLERAGFGNLFFNILLPPFVGDASAEAAGKSLTRRGIDFFGETEPERLGFSFPASYFRSTSRYLVFDAEKGILVIVSRQPIESLKIRAPGRSPRTIDDPDVVSALGVEGAPKEELRLLVSDRAVGIAGGAGGAATDDHYYRLSLEEGEVGYVQVEAGPPIASIPSRWTIFRPAPEAAANAP